MSVSRRRITKNKTTEPSYFFEFVSSDPEARGLRSSHSEIPLTPRQRLIWLDEEMHPNVPVNNWISRFEIGSDIDIEVLREAFFSVIARHDAWRMTVVRTQDGRRARLLEDLPDCFDMIDFSAATDPEAEYEKWFQEMATTVFPSGAPLFHAAIVSLSDSRRIFHLNQHHGTKDGTCDNVLLAELDRAYECLLRTGELPRCDEPAFSFADHMQRVAAEQGSAQWQQRQQFWNDRFHTPPQACEFYGASTESKHPMVERVYANIDPSVVSRTRKFLPHSAVFNVVAFAFLRAITRNDDICVGIAIHNRTAESRNAVGLFMEIVPNRLQIDSEDTFNSLFKKLSSEFARTTSDPRYAVSHPNARYELVVNYRQPVDWKLCGKSVHLEQMPALAVPNRIVETITPGHDWSMLESLSIDIVHSPGTDEAVIAFDFNAGVWSEPQTRDNAVRLFLRLLEAYVSDPDQKIDRIDPAAPDSEEGAFLNTMRTVAPEPELQPLIESWRRRLGEVANLPALHSGDRIVSHQQLHEHVARFAAGLAAQGVGTNDRIVIVARTSVEQTIAFLAVLSLGAVFVPLDPSSPPTRIAEIVRSMTPALVLHDGTLTSSQRRSLKVAAMRLEDEAFNGLEQHPGRSVDPAQAAYIIHTSGSSGTQKAVVVSHAALSSFAKDWVNTLGLGSDDTVLHFYSIAFDSWLTGIVPVLATGAAQVIPALSDIPSSDEVFDEITNKNVTVADVPTSWLASIVTSLRDGRTHPGDRFRCWTFGGSALPMDIAAAAVALIPEKVRLVNSYGPSEATVSVCAVDLRECDLDARRQVPIGRPNATVGMCIVNASGTPVPFGVAGELWISGSQLATEYWGAPELTAERFVINEQGRWYRTGDLVRWGTDYRLEYLGRNDRQVQIRGHRVEPGEIETLLRAHEDIVDAFVGTLGDAGHERLAAYCVVQSEREFDPVAVKAYLSDRLPLWMIPQHLARIDSIPLNTSGKVDAGALPQIEQSQEVGAVKPGSELERMIQEIWWRVFDTWPIGLDQNFLDLGGHSLLAIEICSRIETCTGKRVTPADLFAHPSVRSLAKSLQSDNDRDYSVVSLNACSLGTPLFCLCGIFMYQPLALALESKCPVFGVYAREESSFFGGGNGSDASGDPLGRLVDQYVEAIRSRQPQGPYRLTGISFGGVVAFEVAQRLRRAGEEVEFVGLIDTVLSSAIRRRWLRWMGIKMRSVIGRAAARIRGRMRGAKPAPTLADAEDARHTVTLERVLSRYRPRPFQGRILLISAADRESFPGCDVDPSLGWADIARRGLSVCHVTGTHLSVLAEENAAEVAAAFARQIDAAGSVRQTGHAASGTR